MFFGLILSAIAILVGGVFWYEFACDLTRKKGALFATVTCIILPVAFLILTTVVVKSI